VTGEAGRERGPLATALVRGALAFAWVALAGQAIAFAEYAASGLYRPWSWVKIGLLYVLSFCGVAFDTVGATPGSAPSRVRLVLMLGTALVVWLAFRAGRSTAGTAGMRDVRRAGAWGAAPALAFALLSGLGSLLVTLRFPDEGIERLRPVTWEAFVISFAVVAVAGAAGGVAAAVGGRPTRMTEIVAGGWRMFVAALLLAFAGVMVLAALEPAATRGYAQALRGLGVGGAVLFGQHLLVAPNQSLDVLAPSMGGATELRVQGEVTRLTVRRLEPSEALGLVTEWGSEGVELPPAYLSFLIVPAAATLMGGHRAGGTAIGHRERARRGACAGVVFASLVTAGSLMATVTVSSPGGWSGHLGPAMPSTALLALAWGVAGGVAGSLLPWIRQPVGGEGEPPERSPVPTSA
jgi:hypothetical protein